MEFFAMTGEAEFKDIAVSNLQWICGLNAGITKEAITLGCVIDDPDIGEGEAVPFSMINGIGGFSAGCWTKIKGSICNGFGTGKQFVYDVPPVKGKDRPEALHDEDWITHNGGFLAGLSRMAARRGKK
jgi:hypothetical protein